jgi:hypothetical protein
MDRFNLHHPEEVTESHHGPNEHPTTLTPLPTLDHLAGDPGQVAKLPREVIAALYPPVAGLEAALRARLLGDLGPASPPPEREAEEWLNAEQVEARFGLSRRWLSDHARALRQRRVISKPSRKVALYHRGRLARLLEAASGP